MKYYLKSDLVELSNTKESMVRAYEPSEIHMIENQSRNTIAPEEFREKAYYFNYTLKNIHEKTDVFYTSFPDDSFINLKRDYPYTKRIAENILKLSVIY